MSFTLCGSVVFCFCCCVLYHCMTRPQFIHSFANGCLGCFQFGDILFAPYVFRYICFYMHRTMSQNIFLTVSFVFLLLIPQFMGAKNAGRWYQDLLPRPETVTLTEGSSELNLVAQVPFTLRYLNLELLPPPPNSYSSTHGDLDSFLGKPQIFSAFSLHSHLIAPSLSSECQGLATFLPGWEG